MDNFYQNHRRYVKSRDDDQLLGRVNPTVNSDCKPFATDSEDKIFAPCGAIANSMFNGMERFFIFRIVIYIIIQIDRYITSIDFDVENV